MTIPATSNWCPTCNEACHGHPSTCTVCGATLTNPPNTIPTATTTTTTSTSRTRPLPDSLTAQLRSSTAAFRSNLTSLRERMEAIRNEQDAIRQFFHDSMESSDWNQWMTEALNYTPLDNSRTAAAANVVLDALPRINFSSDNSLFQHCALELQLEDETLTITNSKQNTGKYVIPAIPGEFSRWTSINNNSGESQNHRLNVSNLKLVVAGRHGTGEGGTLTDYTLRTIKSLTQKNDSRVILYMNRGGGLSFVQKAILSQKAGASVCVIGNHIPNGPWPYTMCDSTNEASRLGLTIPTIMISYEHGQIVQKMYREQQRNQKLVSGALIVRSKDHMECCICTEPYTTGCKMIQIQPGCGHYFHEACVLRWLSIHNTCPFCRYALPFEDDGMESHRLLQQRQQDSGQSGNNAPDDFYG